MAASLSGSSSSNRSFPMASFTCVAPLALAAAQARRPESPMIAAGVRERPSSGIHPLEPHDEDGPQHGGAPVHDRAALVRVGRHPGLLDRLVFRRSQLAGHRRHPRVLHVRERLSGRRRLDGGDRRAGGRRPGQAPAGGASLDAGRRQRVGLPGRHGCLVRPGERHLPGVDGRRERGGRALHQRGVPDGGHRHHRFRLAPPGGATIGGSLRRCR